MHTLCVCVCRRMNRQGRDSVSQRGESRWVRINACEHVRWVWSCHECIVIWSWPIHNVDFLTVWPWTLTKTQAQTYPKDIWNVNVLTKLRVFIARPPFSEWIMDSWISKLKCKGRENKAWGHVESMRSEKKEAECKAWCTAFTEIQSECLSICFLCIFQSVRNKTQRGIKQ